MENKLRRQIVLLLKISSFCVFIGWWYAHRYHNPPYMNLFWDEGIMTGIVKFLFGMEFIDFAQSNTVSGNIRNLIHGIGWLFGFTGLLSLFADRLSKLNYNVLLFGPLCFSILASMTYINAKFIDERGALFVFLGLFGLVPIIVRAFTKKENVKKVLAEKVYPKYFLVAGVFMFFLALLAWKDRFYTWAQFFEFSIQVGVPFILYHVLYKEISIRSLVFTLKGVSVLTFVAHGVYALGIKDMPGGWPSMVMNVLGVSQSVAGDIVFLAGVLDMIVAVLIFLPGFAKYALVYMVFWGLATAVARLWGNFYIDLAIPCIENWWYHTLFRLPHAIIPLTCLVIYNSGVDVFSRAKINISLLR